MSNSISNFLPLSRKVFNHEFWEEERIFSRFEAWLDLVASARFDHTEGRKLIKGVVVRWQRGQMPTSIRFLAARWGWTNAKVQRYLILLKQQQMITTDTAEGTVQTIITICNYDTYNSQKAGTDHQPADLRYDGDTNAVHPRYQTNKENKEEDSKERKIYKRFAHLCLFDDEFLKLTDYGYTQTQIDDVLDQIKNYKGHKKYISLFLTAKNWLQKNCAKKGSGGAAAAGSYSKPQTGSRVGNIASAFQQAMQYSRQPYTD